MRNLRSTAVDVALAFARRRSALRRPSRRDHFQAPSDVAAEIVHARGRAAAVVIHGIVAVARRLPGGADKGSCLGSRHGASLFWPRLRRLTRKAAEVRGGMRSAGPGPEAFVGIPFRPGPTLRAIVIRERPAFGPVRTAPILAPDGRAGLALPGPGTPASPQACRPRRPFVQRRIRVPGSASTRWTKVAAPRGTAADERARSTAPQGREGRRP